MGLLNPTKQKLKVFVVFLIGILVFRIAELIMKIFLSRSLGVEGYTNLIGSYGYIILLVFVYLILFYILISIIYSMAKKKD